MTPKLHRVGQGQHPVVVIDDFTGDIDAVAALADEMAPFPDVDRGYYPGVRRLIEDGDTEAFAYARDACGEAAQFIAGAFGYKRFELVSVSFSIVTMEPGALRKPQRAPHFDSTDPGYLAMLHYVRLPVATGTAFYRQRSTEIEQVDDRNVDRFIAAAEREMGTLPGDVGYIQGSNAFFEELTAFEAIPDRMLIYQGSLLHCGIIPPETPLDADPRVGRLTANFFLQGH